MRKDGALKAWSVMYWECLDKSFSGGNNLTETVRERVSIRTSCLAIGPASQQG